MEKIMTVDSLRLGSECHAMGGEKGETGIKKR